jgi:hypothetical protein
MSKITKLATAVGIALILAGCATTSFISTWKNPAVPPLDKPKGQTIVAAVAAEDEYIRHDAEDTLAAELTKRGYKGVPSYTLLPPGLKDEAIAKAAFEKAGAVAAVVIRPLATEQELSVSASVYTGPYYGGFWGGYWGYGWGYPYSASSVQTDTIIIVETLVYSLELNKLIWSGRSKTTNPSKVASFVKELATNVGWEMNKAGVFK